MIEMSDECAVTGTRRAMGRAMLYLAALGAGVSALSAIVDVADAGSATKVVEAWRMCGLAAFCALFVLLARSPYRRPGLWGVVIANKLALTATAAAFLASGPTSGADTVVLSDGALTVLLVTSYFLHAPRRRSHRRTSAG